MRLNLWRIFTSGVFAAAACAQEPPEAEPAPLPAPVSARATAEPEMPPPARPVSSLIEAQVELHRRGFSCGSIDGVMGLQTAGALRAYQRSCGLKDTGVLDAATRKALEIAWPALDVHVFTPDEIGGLRPVPATWLGKSQESTLGYATALELVAEHYRANPKFIRQINPDVDWDHVLPGVKVKVPAVDQALIATRPIRLVIGLAAHELEGVDENGHVVMHFPVSIAKMAEKRPVGELHVTVVIAGPNYTFDPAVFAESAEARELGRKLIIPPGPNNPVGRAWIGLDRPGYGIHGTPDPEKVGRTESHGCFRLANWDALTLLDLVYVGMPVIVEP